MTGRVVIATPHPRYDQVEAALLQAGLDVVRLRARDDLTVERLDAIAPSHVFFPHWSWKIPTDVYERHTCVVFHMTDLPFGRGGSPLQNLIARGHVETQLSALRCVAELDAGPIYLKRPLSLLGTAEEIFLRAAGLMPEMMLDIVNHQRMPTPQSGEATEFKRRRPEEGNLVGLTSLDKLHDFIRMLDAEGYPPAFIEIGQLRLEFSRASRRPGHIDADVRITVIDHTRKIS